MYSDDNIADAAVLHYHLNEYFALHKEMLPRCRCKILDCSLATLPADSEIIQGNNLKYQIDFEN